MSTSSEKHDTPAVPPQRSTALLLLGTIADTTWRMFVPTLAGIAGGYALDSTFGTQPWLFAAGTILGCVLAGILIKQQLQKKI